MPLIVPLARRRRTRSWHEDVAKPTRSANTLLVIDASFCNSAKIFQSTGSRGSFFVICRTISGVVLNFPDPVAHSWHEHVSRISSGVRYFG